MKNKKLVEEIIQYFNSKKFKDTKKWDTVGEDIDNIIESNQSQFEDIKKKGKITDFVNYFKQTDKEIIDVVGENEWINEKIYFPSEIIDLVDKWLKSN